MIMKLKILLLACYLLRSGKGSPINKDVDENFSKGNHFLGKEEVEMKIEAAQYTLTGMYDGDENRREFRDERHHQDEIHFKPHWTLEKRDKTIGSMNGQLPYLEEGQRIEDIGQLQGVTYTDDGQRTEDIGQLQGQMFSEDGQRSEDIGQLHGMTYIEEGQRSEDLGQLQGQMFSEYGQRSEDIGQLQGMTYTEDGQRTEDIEQLVQGIMSSEDKQRIKNQETIQIERDEINASSLQSLETSTEAKLTDEMVDFWKRTHSNEVILMADQGHRSEVVEPTVTKSKSNSDVSQSRNSDIQSFLDALEKDINKNQSPGAVRGISSMSESTQNNQGSGGSQNKSFWQKIGDKAKDIFTSVKDKIA